MDELHAAQDPTAQPEIEGDGLSASLLQSFLHADPAVFEQVRRQHCRVCQLTAAEGLSAPTRRRTCEKWRCGLRDPERFQLEQEWATVTLHTFSDPATSTEEDLANLNHHLAAAGCAAVGLVRGPQGRIGLGINASTLRGELHATIVGLIATRAGAMTRDLATMTIADVQSASHGRRDSDLERMKQRAAAMRIAGLPDKRIAQQMKVDPKTIRNWLGRREEA